jgi:hypothetical protein
MTNNSLTNVRNVLYSFIFVTAQKGTGNITQPNYCLTTEAQSSQRKDFFVCWGGANRQKASVSNKLPWPRVREIMENRHLPILHKKILPCILRVSNESRFVGRVGGENQFVRICCAMRYASS